MDILESELEIYILQENNKVGRLEFQEQGSHIILRNIYVEPRYRNNKNATKMIQHMIIKYERKYNLIASIKKDNQNAKRLLERNGFEKFYRDMFEPIEITYIR